MFLFNKILFNKLVAAAFLFFFYCQLQNVTGHHVATNLDNKIKSCCSVDDRLLNLTTYEFMMIQQTISQQCVLCWAKRELFVYPAMFPYLPEHLAGRFVIFYACVTMVLDSYGPIIQFKSMSLKKKQKA